jgi:riboflavin transporter FmnP
VAVGSFLLIFALFFKEKTSAKSYVIGSILATLTMTVSMVVANFVYAIPLYAKFAHFDIDKILGTSRYLMAMVVPFNLLEGAIFAVSFAIIFVALKSILENLARQTVKK